MGCRAQSKRNKKSRPNNAREPVVTPALVAPGCSVNLSLAAIAAAVASVGDLLMLYVANAARPELGLAVAPPIMLWAGALLGVVAIPFYALGYRSVASLVAPRFASHARIIAGTGTVGSLLGAVIHGATAFFIRDALAWGEPARDPTLASRGGAPPLLAMWGIATVLIVAASVAFALAVRSGGVSRVPRALAWANPAVLTLLLALVGATSALGQAFVVPAAPNLAHFVFFAACTRATRADATPA